jgi:sugar-phosphatase
MSQEHITIKVIVTDMDGTFLDDAKQYDRALWRSIRN